MRVLGIGLGFAGLMIAAAMTGGTNTRVTPYEDPRVPPIPAVDRSFRTDRKRGQPDLPLRINKRQAYLNPAHRGRHRNFQP